MQLVMFIYALKISQKMSSDTKKFLFLFACNFSISCFSYSGTHQYHHLDGCQAIGKSSSAVEAF